MATTRGAIYEFEYLGNQQCVQVVLKGRQAGLLTNDFHLQALIADSLIRGVKAEADYDPATNVIGVVRTSLEPGVPYDLRPKDYRVLWSRFYGPPSEQITEAVLEDPMGRRVKVRARGTSAFAVLATAMKTQEWLEEVEFDISRRYLLRAKIRRSGKAVPPVKAAKTKTKVASKSAPARRVQKKTKPAATKKTARSKATKPSRKTKSRVSKTPKEAG